MDPRFIFAALSGVLRVALIFAAVTTVRHISATPVVAQHVNASKMLTPERRLDEDRAVHASRMGRAAE
jgi:hypothetical protein